MKNEMPQAAIILVDREGKKFEEGMSNPIIHSLHMNLTLSEEQVYIEMHATAHAMGNGSAGCKVVDLQTGEVVYEGGGTYFSLGEGSTPEVYVPGPWEEAILKRSKKYVEKIR